MIFRIFTALFLMCGTLTFAQEESKHIKFLNEGNEAFKDKDYAKALAAFESALDVWSPDAEPDALMIYNAANCARRINDNEKALKYFTLSKELNYKPDLSAYYMATALNELDREEDMEQLLLKSLDDYKTSNILAHIKKMLVTYYLKRGNEFYNQASQSLISASNAAAAQSDEIIKRANEAFAKAKPWFEKILVYDANNESALSSLKEIDSSLSGEK